MNNNVRIDGKYLLGEQILRVYGPHEFEVEHDHNYELNAPGAIKSYPCIQHDFKPPRTIDSFTQHLIVFDSTNPEGPGEWNSAVDVWFGAWGAIKGELMVWPVHQYNGPLPPRNAVEHDRVTIDGQEYIAWKRPLNKDDPRPYIALVMTPMKSEGTIDLLKIFKWCVSKGWLKGTDTIAATEFGVEIAHGGGSRRIHRVNNFELFVG